MAEDNPFDHLIQRDELDEVERLLSKERQGPKLNEKEKKEKQKTLMELLVGSNNQGDLARKFNVDPDMSDKVLVPVLNFLDKYGVGDSIAGNPAAQTAGSLIEFLTDVTPVVKNAMEYFAGKQKELSDEDRDFLNQIKEAQTTGDMGLFIGETLEPETVEEPVEERPVKKPKTLNEGIPLDRDILTDGVDWEEAMGISPSPQEEYDAEVHNTFMTVGLERLAAESGMTMQQIRGSDRQLKTNNFGATANAIDYTEPLTLDLGLEKINEAMASEKQRISHSSKVTFKDSDKMPVPTNLAGDSNPMDGTSRMIPSFSGFLEPIDLTLLEDIPEEVSEAPWQEEEFHPTDFDEVISYPTEEELAVEEPIVESEVKPAPKKKATPKKKAAKKSTKKEKVIETEIIDEGVVENDGGEKEE